MAKSSSSGAVNTVITILVVLVGGYVVLKVLGGVVSANAQSNAQNQNIVQKLLNQFKQTATKASQNSGNSGLSLGSSSSGVSGLIASLKQAWSDGQSAIGQLNPFTDDSGLPLIGDQSISDAWSVLGEDFGLDPSLFNDSLPSTDNSTDSAGYISSNPVGDFFDSTGFQGFDILQGGSDDLGQYMWQDNLADSPIE